MTIKSINAQTGEVTVSQGAAPSFVTEEQSLAAARAGMVASAMQERKALLAIGRLAEVEAIVSGGRRRNADRVGQGGGVSPPQPNDCDPRTCRDPAVQ